MLDNPLSTLSLNANWLLSSETFRAWSVEGDNGCSQGPVHNDKRVGHKPHEIIHPFSMTEEFVGVYRMRHPLLSAELEVDGEKVSLHGLSFKDAHDLTNEYNAAKVVLQALAASPTSTLSLRNYPHTLYDRIIHGRETVNLAGIDLNRDRERNLLRYSDVHRLVLLDPKRLSTTLRNTRKTGNF